jgi:hypothetical protein
MHHFSAEPIRMRILREKKEDTLAAGMEQRDAAWGVRKYKIENGNSRIGLKTGRYFGREE